jgi:fumarate hydratase subunit beta
MHKEQGMRQVKLPMSDAIVRSLVVGEPVMLSGVILTGRDSVHKWMYDTFIKKTRLPEGDDLDIYEAILPLLDGGIIYHCGPVVSGLESGDYRFVAAGPTTSIREEPYQGAVMHHFNLKGVIGKGGMGSKTLAACQEVPGTYMHAVGGAASLIAKTVERVMGVYKLVYGVPEAIWVIEVKDFPVVVTMDSHGKSLHADVEERSGAVLERLLARG